LGERIESALLDILSLATQAYYANKQRGALLIQANQQTAVLRHLWRLSYELKVIDKRKYNFGSELIENIGRQVGGWQRSCDNSR